MSRVVAYPMLSSFFHAIFRGFGMTQSIGLSTPTYEMHLLNVGLSYVQCFLHRLMGAYNIQNTPHPTSIEMKPSKKNGSSPYTKHLGG